MRAMPYRRLQRILLVLTALFLVLLEIVRFWVGHKFLSTSYRMALSLGFVAAGVVFLAMAFSVLAARHRRMQRRNQSLLALYEASQILHNDHLSLPGMLQRVVDQACKLIEARYGAVSVIDPDYRIRQFITSGVSDEVRERIGEPPRGRGLLGVVLRQGQKLRMDDLTKDPRSAGFPEHHPPMSTLLAVPIVCIGPFRGNLYLAEKESTGAFTEEDEEALRRFATAAAIAIDNAHLHERSNALAVSEERLRIAREMHDGMAQVLAYVNTKAQAVSEFLRQGRHEEGSRQLDQLADAARSAYQDVREGILALRTRWTPEQTLNEAMTEFLERWEEQSGVQAELAMPDVLPLPPSSELQLLRILQEALANVRKHSGATRAEIFLERRDSHVYARVSDDGTGFDPELPRRRRFPRFGLAIMRERAESIGGRLDVHSAPGEGTRVEVTLPIPEDRA